MTRGFEESNLRAVLRTDKVYLYNKTLILQIDKRLARNFWRSGGRKPSAVALFKPSNIKINSSEKMNEFIPPSISIVIPVFNVEKYIGECLDSLLLQTFDKFEVICIIDGSTDNSENIIKSGKYQSLNLKIINIPNSGQSIARNIGIHNATGEFILFLDSDDKIRNDTLKKCIEELEENELDGVFFEGQAFSNTLKKNKMKKYNYNRPIINRIIKELYNISIESHLFTVQPCCYIVKKNIIKSINFIPSVYHEDNAYTIELLFSGKLKKIKIINEKFFLRRLRLNSTMTSIKNIKHTKGYLASIKIFSKIIKESNDKRTKKNLSLYLEKLFLGAIISNSSCTTTDKITNLKDELLKIISDIGIKNVTLKTKTLPYFIPYFSLRKNLIKKIRSFKCQ